MTKSYWNKKKVEFDQFLVNFKNVYSLKLLALVLQIINILFYSVIIFITLPLIGIHYSWVSFGGSVGLYFIVQEIKHYSNTILKRSK